MFAEPPLDLFFLRGQYDPLPFHYTRALTVLRHDIRTFIEHLDEAIGLCPLKMVRRKGRLVFLHLLYYSRNPPLASVWATFGL